MDDLVKENSEKKKRKRSGDYSEENSDEDEDSEGLNFCLLSSKTGV
jgi:hypothetical protein